MFFQSCSSQGNRLAFRSKTCTPQHEVTSGNRAVCWKSSRPRSVCAAVPSPLSPLTRNTSYQTTHRFCRVLRYREIVCPDTGTLDANFLPMPNTLVHLTDTRARWQAPLERFSSLETALSTLWPILSHFQYRLAASSPAPSLRLCGSPSHCHLPSNSHRDSLLAPVLTKSISDSLTVFHSDLCLLKSLQLRYQCEPTDKDNEGRL